MVANMTVLNRRRFLMISAAALLAGKPSLADPLRQWRSRALGAEVVIALAHPDGEGIARRVFAEIERLEQIFSLYRKESELSRLNRDGSLRRPSFELLECLSLSAAVGAATHGAFEPTVQPLWHYYAQAHEADAEPDPDSLERLRTLIGFQWVAFGSEEVRYLKPGMAMTLNGIAQGLIADKVAALLREEGLTNVFINTGEIQALGSSPQDGPQGWLVSLKAGEELLPGRVLLKDRALATSAPLGTTFDGGGRLSHILDPRTGLPVKASRRLVSVSSRSAAIADALSTAGCLLEEIELTKAISSVPGAKLERIL